MRRVFTMLALLLPLLVALYPPVAHSSNSYVRSSSALSSLSDLSSDTQVRIALGGAQEQAMLPADNLPSNTDPQEELYNTDSADQNNDVDSVDQPDQQQDDSHHTTGYKMLVDANDTKTANTLSMQGATLLVDYGAFQLWYVPQSSAYGSSAQMLAQHAIAPSTQQNFDTIYLRGQQINPVQKQFPAVPTTLQQAISAEPAFWMVQFIGPVRDEWLQEVQQTGMQIVSYMPNYAYVVWGDSAAHANLLQLVSEASFIQWSGPYHPSYRLAPSLHRNSERVPDERMVDVTVQVYTTKTTTNTIEHLLDMGGTLHMAPKPLAAFTFVALQLPENQLEAIAAWNDVYNVEPWIAIEKLDEAQSQIVAGNIISVENTIIPTGPGYLDWLDSKGFPTDPSHYPIVDVVDDGVDTGDLEDVRHPDFYQLGDTDNPHRIAYMGNCTSDKSGDGADGHGNINVGIVGGYNNISDTLYVDDRGYSYGLGISPYGRLASTKIFANYDGFDISGCDDSFQGIVEHVYQSGGMITSNSWGSSSTYYNYGALAYDILTRDATEEATGNQEMLHVFSAGNSGRSGLNTVGAPGNAKNVLTVGATENVRDDGITDGCGSSASDNADDIANFSSRGPTDDGRMKPDIVAPGVHIQGPASQDDGFSGYGVCGMFDTPYYPEGQTLYTWSTGTSHSAPAVAGATSLVYEYYNRILHPGHSPSPAMIKALILNGARYLDGKSSGDTLPSPYQGWGGLYLKNVFDTTPRSFIDQVVVFQNSGEEYQVEGTIHDPTKPLRVSLVWTDAPGSTTGNVLANDLDLEVQMGGKTYRGNMFDGAFSIPNGTVDSLNNVEQVFLPAGLADSFRVRVIARNIAGDGIPDNQDETDQDFALVITNDSAGTGSYGYVKGRITDSETGELIPRATIKASLGLSQTITFMAKKDGTFSIPLPEGDYSFTVSAYSYAPMTVSGITIDAQKTTQRDISLISLPKVTVRGRVTDEAIANRPVYARILVSVEGYEKTIFTDPSTGAYSVRLLPDVTHTFSVQSVAPNEYEQPYVGLVHQVTPTEDRQVFNFPLKVNRYACTASGYERTYTSSFYYFEDFEADDGAYQVFWLNPWRWGEPNRTYSIDQAHSGNKVWQVTVPNVENNRYNGLISPAIDLSAYEHGHKFYISWWQWIESIESNIASSYYEISLLVSTDGGETWEHIFNNDDMIQGLWTQQGVLLDSSYAVPDLRFRFEVYEDSYRELSAIYYAIDDVGIQVVEDQIVYREDFETIGGKYQRYAEATNSSWAWGVPITGPGYAHSGKNVWATNLNGDYNSREDSAIVSPEIDLSAYVGQSVTLSWWQWLYTDYDDDAMVEISNDGGETWERVYEDSGEEDLRWNQVKVSLEPDYAVASFRIRFRINSDGYSQTPGYYIDDVQLEVPPYPCLAQETGALVVGHVYDENTGEGLKDAVVFNQHGYMVKTLETPDDPAIEDGLYQLFLPAQETILTAHAGGAYAESQANLDILPGFTFKQDFWLSAGQVVPAPAGLESTMRINDIITIPLTLSNTGKLSVSYTLREQEYGYQPLNTEDTSPKQGLIQSRAIDVLIVATSSTEFLEDTLLEFSDIRSITTFDARQQTPTLDDLLAYDSVLLVVQNSFADPVALGDVLADYLDAGGKLIQTAPTFYKPDTTDTQWVPTGRFATEGYSPLIGTGNLEEFGSLSYYDETHPIMRDVSTAKDPMRQKADLAKGATLVASWSDKQPFVAIQGSVVALNTYIGQDNAWYGDVDIVIHNSLVWLDMLETQPWFSIASFQGGSIHPDMSVPVTVTFNTLDANTMQPGSYVGLIQVLNDAPYGDVTIPITMNLSTPDNWGKLSGTVTGMGYCNKEPEPMVKAQVVVENQHGMAWNLTTDVSGTYQIWIEQTTSPLTITVTAKDHQQMQYVDISLEPNQETTQDVAMRWENPCIETNRDQIIANVLPGKKRTVYLDLTNSGVGTATVEVNRMSLGFVPLGLNATEPFSETTLPVLQRVPWHHDVEQAPVGKSDILLQQMVGQGTPIPTGVRYRASATTCDGSQLYLFGGWDTAGTMITESWRYDVASDTWTELAPLPVAVANMEAACIGSRIYLVGGYDGDYHTNSFLIYNTVQDRWRASTWESSVTPMLAVWKGKLYATGGFPGPSANTWSYDPVTEVWKELAPMPYPRGYGSFVTVGDYIYLVGGAFDMYLPTSTYRYNPILDVWDESGPLLNDGRMSALTVWYGEYLYIFGGGGNDDSYWSPWQTAEVYNPSLWPQGEWVYTDTLPMSLVAMAGACVDGKVWSMGGTYGSGDTSINQYLDNGFECHHENNTDLSWLSDVSMSSVLDSGESRRLAVTLDASGAASLLGAYNASLSIISSDPINPWQEIPVRMEVYYPLYLPLVSRGH